ncbi:DUF3298 domain-containing protein [Bacteroides sp. 214]|uniref:DUF3298 and DUF4163 domain-containing protein n=1 Tax=Bacteroides sp. 214 TaxID=2302935 RepID=UPI0013D0B075|nr:DUF3298 and DUF4163 domain-containing protein [Bacteroides sp. 214]NDW12828.1 DUF3298 domain-containing protein [Bacteroides sp. 214]
MKKQYVTLFAILVYTSLIYSSCGNKSATGALIFDKVELNEETHMFGDTAKPGATLAIKFAYPLKSNDEVLKDTLIKIFASACFEDELYVGEPQNMIRLYANNYFDTYHKELEPMYLEDIKDKDNTDYVRSWYSYYKDIESKILLYKGDLLTYSVHFNEYTGGAHPSYRTMFLNIDLSEKKILGLTDFFAEGYEEMLTDLLWNQLMLDKNVASREALKDMGYGLMDDLFPTENFCLEEDGMLFHYNIYEFTPYVMGAVEIKLPYDAIKHLMVSNKIISQIKK